MLTLQQILERLTEILRVWDLAPHRCHLEDIRDLRDELQRDLSLLQEPPR